MNHRYLNVYAMLISQCAKTYADSKYSMTKNEILQFGKDFLDDLYTEEVVGVCGYAEMLSTLTGVLDQFM